MMRRIAAVWAVALLALGTASAADLEQGIELYWSGKYADTVEALTLVQQRDLRADEKIECFKYLAFAHVALGNNDQARDAFTELLASDPHHVLDEAMVSPKIVRQFETARAELVESLFAEGKASYFDKDYAATRRTMNRVLALDEDHALAKEYGQLASEQEVLLKKAAALEAPRASQLQTELDDADPEPDDVVYRQTGQMTSPVLVARVNPEYPVSARRAGKEGTVVMTIVIDVDGSVREAKIIRRLYPALDKAALDAVRQWKYRPARMEGRAVAVYSVVNLSFQLDR